MNVKPIPLFSGAIYRRLNFFVYLPPSYESGDRHYPVIYLLHGMHGSESDWCENGNAPATIESMISSGDYDILKDNRFKPEEPTTA